MRHLKKNWRILTVTCVLVLGGGLWWGLGDHGRAVADPPGGYQLATPAQRDAVLGMMAEVSLDREAFAALNVSTEQAANVVVASRGWWEENQESLASLKAVIDSRTRELEARRAAIRRGPAEAGQDEALATAVTNLLAAREAYTRALSPLRVAVGRLLSPSQQSAWASVEKGYGQRMSLRLLDLSGEQRVALGKARRLYRLTYTAAETRDQREAAVSTWNAALSSILTGGQADVVDAYMDYWVASAEAVDAAIEAVLPLADA